MRKIETNLLACYTMDNLLADSNKICSYNSIFIYFLYRKGLFLQNVVWTKNENIFSRVVNTLNANNQFIDIVFDKIRLFFLELPFLIILNCM